jgi:hypothetical protein
MPWENIVDTVPARVVTLDSLEDALLEAGRRMKNHRVHTAHAPQDLGCGSQAPAGVGALSPQSP